MSGGITYDGVPVETGGRIFDGLKFWVAQRVPTRSTILDHIQRNSGVVVPLEKDADYCIADHARKDAPSGSISWKFITESVSNGVVQLPDRYAIGHAPAGPRDIASGRPTKRARAPFTAADDEALASWVLAHDRNRTGNEIYQQFEIKHPQHTWQSWRNRFVKKLMLLPPESLLQLASQAVERSAPQARGEDQPDQDLPDPTELMLQRKGQRVQQEAARQRASHRAIEAPGAADEAQTSALSPQRQAAEKDDIATTEAKGRFYRELQMYAEANDIDVTPTQQVAGQPVELWDLSKAVNAQQLPVEEIDWLRVAEDLGYAWSDVDDAVRALQVCYEKNLYDFHDMMDEITEGMEKKYWPDDGDEDPEMTAAASPEAAAARNMPSSPRGQMPSSPPARFLPAKRPLDADGELDIPTPAKRRRLHIPPEIPSTPDADRRHHQSTPGKRPAAASATTPTQAAARLHTRESSLDMTPSQQLQSEHLGSSCSPIPLRLNSAARNRQLGGSGSGIASNTGVKRALPQAWKPRAPPPPPPPAINEEQDDDDAPISFGDDDYDVPDSPFPRALPRTQPPPPPTSRRPAQAAAARRLSKQRELSELIQHYESLGYAHRTVVEGLRRTTMTPGLATVVMQSLREGRGVPAHHEGVWTDRDDAALRLVVDAGGEEDLDADEGGGDVATVKARRKARRARDRLRNKHGKERMALRVKYLRANDDLAAGAAGDGQ